MKFLKAVFLMLVIIVGGVIIVGALGRMGVSSPSNTSVQTTKPAPQSTQTKCEHVFVDNKCEKCGEFDKPLYLHDCYQDQSYAIKAANIKRYVGYVRNDDTRAHNYIKIVVKLRSSDGTVMDSDWTYATTTAIQPGENCRFEIFYYGSVKNYSYFTVEIDGYL